MPTTLLIWYLSVSICHCSLLSICIYGTLAHDVKTAMLKDNFEIPPFNRANFRWKFYVYKYKIIVKYFMFINYRISFDYSLCSTAKVWSCPPRWRFGRQCKGSIYAELYCLYIGNLVPWDVSPLNANKSAWLGWSLATVKFLFHYIQTSCLFLILSGLFLVNFHCLVAVMSTLHILSVGIHIHDYMYMFQIS